MLPADLGALLEPLERVEAMRRRAVRLGARFCDLSYANPYQGVGEGVRAVIRAALDQERLLDLQYTPFGGQTLARRAVADALRASHDLPFAYPDVVLTPGAMAALHAALHACGRPGDEVVIPTPCWLDYPLYVRATNRRAVCVPLAAESFDLDIEAIAAALTRRTCAILLANPANPPAATIRRQALRNWPTWRATRRRAWAARSRSSPTRPTGTSSSSTPSPARPARSTARCWSTRSGSITFCRASDSATWRSARGIRTGRGSRMSCRDGCGCSASPRPRP